VAITAYVLPDTDHSTDDESCFHTLLLLVVPVVQMQCKTNIENVLLVSNDTITTRFISNSGL
jgi:hypothetical protein